MAKRVIQRLIDDIDGSEASETVTFAFDATTYTIDLSEGNAQKLREALAPFAEVATRTGRSNSGIWRPGLAQGTRRTSVVDNKAVRAWAAENGYELSDRGRIPQGVVDAYNDARRSPAEPPKAAKPAEPPKAAKPAEPAKAAKPAEPPKAAKPAEPPKAAKKAARKKAPAAEFQAA